MKWMQRNMWGKKYYLRFHVGTLFHFCLFEDCGEVFINMWLKDHYYRWHRWHWKDFGVIPFPGYLKKEARG